MQPEGVDESGNVIMGEHPAMKFQREMTGGERLWAWCVYRSRMAFRLGVLLCFMIGATVWLWSIGESAIATGATVSSILVLWTMMTIVPSTELTKRALGELDVK